MSVIPCEQDAGLRRQIERFAEVLKTQAHKLGDHGLTEKDFYASPIFRGAIQQVRGEFSATMRDKREFVQHVLNHMEDRGFIASWDRTKRGVLHDYVVNLKSGRTAIIDLKGCLDGDNTKLFERPLFERIASVDLAIAATGAQIEYGGSRACYNRLTDCISIPDERAFFGTETSTAQEAFYSTILHELSHYSGAECRLNREKGKRFADRAYAFEELIAELSAAFLCAELGIANDLRPDHAQYMAQYLTILKNDKKAIFAAAAAASAATDYILAFSRKPQEEAA